MAACWQWKSKRPRDDYAMSKTSSLLWCAGLAVLLSWLEITTTFLTSLTIESFCFTSEELKAMKPLVSTDARQRVIELRRNHSYAEVAKQTGLPVGTVKTICTRSGVFRDNPTHRALFALPAIQASEQTALAVPQLPAQNAVTGDKEIDAVLWLREVIGTGRADLIDKAMLAAKKIKTPLADLEKRYRNYLTATRPGDWTIVFQTIGFADLEDLANRATRKLTLSNEALARFGDAASLFADTPAEQFCINALVGVKEGEMWGLDAQEAAQRFKAHPDLMPRSLIDCLHELAFWHELYSMRDAAGGTGTGDRGSEVNAREDFVFALLAEIRPRDKTESIAVLRYLAEKEYMDRKETDAILLNLIG
jgi:hypothetical protein